MTKEILYDICYDKRVLYDLCYDNRVLGDQKSFIRSLLSLL